MNEKNIFPKEKLKNAILQDYERNTKRIILNIQVIMK